jgi:hypothetical protein
VIARYNHRSNAIEGFALVAERPQPTFTTWDWNPEAIIHTFSPKVQLDLTAPTIRLDAAAYSRAVGQQGRRLQTEIPMAIGRESPHASAGIQSRLMLTKAWPANIITSATPVWPPLILPSSSRTRTDSASNFRDSSHRPTHISELSTSTFRLRKWMEFSSRPYGMNIHVGEELATYATLPKDVYTPTPQKPWQGIWCGDYAGHGVEFLVVTQPDIPNSLPERARWAIVERERERSVSSEASWSTAPTNNASSDDSNGEQSEAGHLSDLEPHLDESWATIDASSNAPKLASPLEKDSMEDADIYCGSIEAIKLTGDPNIPRGEYTFIAPDIGRGGLLRIATEDIFKGARVVKSVGHIAARGYRDGM